MRKKIKRMNADESLLYALIMKFLISKTHSIAKASQQKFHRFRRSDGQNLAQPKVVPKTVPNKIIFLIFKTVSNNVQVCLLTIVLK